MSRRLLSLAALAALAACAPQSQTPPRIGATVFAVDQQGKARLCSVTAAAEPADGSSTEARMTLGNDGGWCGIPVNRPGPQPFTLGLLTRRAGHGLVTIHTVGDLTRLDYAPDPGFSGEDSFAVRLVPGNAELKVAVAVQPAEPVAVPATAPPPPPAARPVVAPAHRAARTPPRRRQP